MPAKHPAYTVYAEQLVTLGHGLPLWDPEPNRTPDDAKDPSSLEDTGEVLIGDVGYVYEGSFRRLFNVTLPPTHSVNKGDVPDDFEVLSFNKKLLSRREKYLDPGPLCSRSVRSVGVEVGGGGGTDIVRGDLAYRFQCNSDRGALLILKDIAKKEHVILNRAFQNYMRKHHESWYNYAANVIQLDLPKEDIILVRGWTKTTAWAVTSWLEQGRAHEVAVRAQGGLPGLVHGSFNVVGKNMSARFTLPETRTGPERSDKARHKKFDQCVFLSYYKIKYRKWILPSKIEAGAGPRQLPPDSKHEGGPNVEVNTSSRQFSDPVGVLLDYILKHSDADIAIACDGDINELLGYREWPEDLASYLEEHTPKIEVDEHKTGRLFFFDVSTDPDAPSEKPPSYPANDPPQDADPQPRIATGSSRLIHTRGKLLPPPVQNGAGNRLLARRRSPLIPEHVLSVRAQWLLILTFGILCQAAKAIDFYYSSGPYSYHYRLGSDPRIDYLINDPIDDPIDDPSSETGPRSTNISLKWMAIDTICCIVLSQLRIPGFVYPRYIVVIQIALFCLLDWLFYGLVSWTPVPGL